jgi:YD repeat-containing protein
MDRLLKEIDPLGNVTAFKYDSNGNKIKEIAPDYYNEDTDDGTGYRFEYDENGRLIRITNPSGQQSRIIYDAVGNQVKTIDANQYDESTDSGFGMQYEYDAMNRLICVRDTEGKVIKKILYNADGRIIKVIDAKGYLYASNDDDRYGTVYKYNLGGWLTETRVPKKEENGTVLYSIKRYVYDKNGRVIEEKRSWEYVTLTGEPENWNTIYYTYDKNGRVKTITDDTGAYMEYSYDCLGNTVYEKIKINDDKYMMTEYLYNAAGYVDTIRLRTIILKSTTVLV